MAGYCSNLFSRSGGEKIESILEGMPHSITPSMNENLTRSVNEEEIKSALFAMNPNKSPGLDGMTPLFFQKFWKIVKIDLVKAIDSFFYSGHMLKSMNHTLISLIPKVLNPTDMKHYRPISLCNVVYKIISKILANRLKNVLNFCISKN